MARKRSYDTLIGGSVGWNQLIQNGDFSDGTTEWIAASGTGSVENNIYTLTPNANYGRITSSRVNFLKGHKYFATVDVKSTETVSIRIYARTYFAITAINVPANVWTKYCGIKQASDDAPDGTGLIIQNNNSELYGIQQYKNVMLIDLTLLLGSTIADYIYSLESATAGAGIAKLREWGFISDAYIPYDAGSIKSVEASAKVTRDASDNIIGNYPLDSSLILRGIPKLDSNGQLYYDGDRYEADGTVTRRYGIRAYQEGDETSDTMITDGTNTVYKLTSTTTESADPFTNPQTVDPDGTEEYVTSNGVPVGHETRYQL